jgi:predicted RNase H-like nuclease (RuvC/YqgF family)
MPALRETLGDKGFEELEGLIIEKVRLYSVSRDEFIGLSRGLDMVEHDLSDLKTEVRELRREMNELRKEMNERFDRMHERMVSMKKWTVGTLALFGSIISILLAIGQFAK